MRLNTSDWFILADQWVVKSYCEVFYSLSVMSVSVDEVYSFEREQNRKSNDDSQRSPMYVRYLVIRFESGVIIF